MKVAPPSSVSDRIAAFDGLRGTAAAIVVLFHYLCLVHPNMVIGMGSGLSRSVDTPLHLFWNGPFAVVIFFVLSGFVMAAAADKRHDELLANCLTRYVRLALPVTTSCLLAWLWLTLFPNAAETMQRTLENPSHWLIYTMQEPILPIWYAALDGMLLNFLRGYSGYNNVLWTMKIELLGSFGIFILYRFSSARTRLLILLFAAPVIMLLLPSAYLSFVLGAGLYEARKRNALARLPAAFPLLGLIFGVLLGSPGQGAPGRLGIPWGPAPLQLGNPGGIIPAIAAALMLYAAMMLPPLTRLLSRGPLVFLGRISFGLYLLHVPLLYTFVAWSVVQGAPKLTIAPCFALGATLSAYGFTLMIDEPILRQVSKLRLVLNWWTGRRGYHRDK